MAKIFPEHLPESVLNDVKRSAERRFYEAASRLSNKYTVFYSVAWQARDRAGDIRDGEADFVIAHPELGLLVIEVKGGGIRFDGSSGEWFSGPYSIKDPAEQAKKNRYELFRKLQDLPGWDKSWMTIGHAVAFPDIVVENTDLRLDLPNEIILDNSSLENIEPKLQEIFRYYAGGEGGAGAPGQNRIELIKKLLTRSFQIHTPLGVEMGYEDDRLINLTERQMLILDFLSNRRRAAIKGCAGSGKTMLAMEKARRLASEGFDVLLTCYNAALATSLARHVPERITVMHFHGLCRELVKEAGFAIRPIKDQQELYDVVMPEMLVEAVDQTGPLFDAIIVDEGQDFKENWWLPLVNLLRDQDQGILFVFYDDNQNIYKGSKQISLVVEEAPFPLIDNCRNTQKIHGLVSIFHQEGQRLRCQGPAGRPPEVLEYTDIKGMQHLLSQVLHRLVNEEQVSLQDIAVLTPRSQDRSDLKANTRIGNFLLTTSSETEGKDRVQVSSVHTFKGLERRVIIIAELDNAMIYLPEEILYVGCSRARTHLILLCDADWSTAAKSKVQSYVH